jgi:hypothetical protein
MWYLSAWFDSAGARVTGKALSHAVSADGLKWEKRPVGQFAILGSLDNNVCLQFPDSDGETVGVLRNPAAAGPADQWLTGFTATDNGEWRYDFYESAEGLRWNRRSAWRPPPPHKADRACLAWDPVRRDFAFYSRVRHRSAAPAEWFGDHWWGRAVTLARSPDLRAWSEPELVMAPDAQDPPATEIYSLMAWPYGGMWLGLAQTYCSRTDVASIEVQFAFSRDGVRWTRVRERPAAPFLGLGGVGEWDRFNQAVAMRPVEVDGRLRIYYSGRAYRHSGYKGADSDPAGRHGIGLLSLRADGWCSIDGSFDDAAVLTRPLLLPPGALHLNAKADFGALRVAVLDEAGGELAASAPISVDSTDAAVEFPGGNPFASAAGQPLRLRFNLANARLYSFWIE